jgi:hypothetical protein
MIRFGVKIRLMAKTFENASGRRVHHFETIDRCGSKPIVHHPRQMKGADAAKAPRMHGVFRAAAAP